jgi:hypothetical protein
MTKSAVQKTVRTVVSGTGYHIKTDTAHPENPDTVLCRKPGRTEDRSSLHGPAVHAHRGLAQGFRHGRLGLAGAGDVFGASAEFHGQAGPADQLANPGTDHMDALDAPGLGMLQHLHEPFSLMIAARPRIGNEQGLAD